jgi:hypothetical protein
VSAVWFLVAAVLISAIGSTVLVVRQRKPTGLHSSIDSFRREMDALAPPDRRADSHNDSRHGA